MRGEPKPEAAPLQRARAEPLGKAASAATRCKAAWPAMRVRWRHRMAETLRGSGRLSRLATGLSLACA